MERSMLGSTRKVRKRVDYIRRLVNVDYVISIVLTFKCQWEGTLLEEGALDGLQQYLNGAQETDRDYGDGVRPMAQKHPKDRLSKLQNTAQDHCMRNTLLNLSQRLTSKNCCFQKRI